MFWKKKSPPGGLRCSFCNKSQREVRKLIAGPHVYICDECVDICLTVLSTDRVDSRELNLENRWPPSEISACALCRVPIGVAEALVVADRGLVCRECLGELQAAIAREKIP
jgi:hypothetical protein